MPDLQEITTAPATVPDPELPAPEPVSEPASEPSLFDKLSELKCTMPALNWNALLDGLKFTLPAIPGIEIPPLPTITLPSLPELQLINSMLDTLKVPGLPGAPGLPGLPGQPALPAVPAIPIVTFAPAEMLTLLPALNLQLCPLPEVPTT